MKKILIVERDQEMSSRLSRAFESVGYLVYSAIGTADAIIQIRNCNAVSFFDLVIVDIAADRDLEIMTAIEQMQIPVFTVMDSADKQLIIDTLGRKRTDFIERFIETQKTALYNGTSGRYKGLPV